MFAVYRELEGTAYLVMHAIRRLGMLRLPPVMEEFMRQIYFTGAPRPAASCCAARSSAR